MAKNRLLHGPLFSPLFGRLFAGSPFPVGDILSRYPIITIALAGAVGYLIYTRVSRPALPTSPRVVSNEQGQAYLTVSGFTAWQEQNRAQVLADIDAKLRERGYVPTGQQGQE